MSSPGPKRKVSDTRLLFELLASKDRSVLAAEVQSNVELSTVQSVRDRLNSLAESTDYVAVKSISNRNMYQLTDAGREKVTTEIRKQLD